MSVETRAIDSTPAVPSFRRIIPKFETTPTFNRRLRESQDHMVAVMDRALLVRRAAARRLALKGNQTAGAAAKA